MKRIQAILVLLQVSCGGADTGDDGLPRADIPEGTECLLWTQVTAPDGMVFERCSTICVDPFSGSGTCDLCSMADAELRDCLERGVVFEGSEGETRLPPGPGRDMACGTEDGGARNFWCDLSETERADKCRADPDRINLDYCSMYP